MDQLPLESACPTIDLIDSDSDGSPSHSITNDDIQIMQEEVTLRPNLPNVNVAEKIILCIDVCIADQTTVYKLADGTTYSPLNMVKKILEFFVQLKSTINSKTEFALMLLRNDDIVWLSMFTSKVKDIVNKIDTISAVHCNSSTFDFGKVFVALMREVTIPEYDERTVLPPPYVVRMIVLYGRSKCIPQIPIRNYDSLLRNKWYLFIDILLMHDEDCDENDCEKIYDALQNLDMGYSFVFEVSRNATKAHDCMAKLLAHPLQRPLQKNTRYTFKGCADL